MKVAFINLDEDQIDLTWSLWRLNWFNDPLHNFKSIQNEAKTL